MLAFHILGLAIASLWVTISPWFWNALLVIAAGAALYLGMLEPAGLGLGTLAALSTYAYFRMPLQRDIRFGAAAFLIVLQMGLLAHVLPGFPVLPLYTDVVLTPGAYPTSLYWSFDKPLAGLLLMGWGVDRIRGFKDWVRILPVSLGLFIACAGLILAVAWPLGLIRWAPKPASLTALFAFTNLFFVCVAEEAFFRGFLQRKLADRWSGKPDGTRRALIATSVIFGVCHFAGGIGLILLASIAGLFYGLAYQRTGRVEAGILVHFLLNFVHYAFFTYPVLRINF